MFKQFNDLAKKFLDRMAITFPEERKVIDYKYQFDSMIRLISVGMLNQEEPVKVFMSSMVDYGEKILRKDEMFFKQDDFVGHAESISGRLGLIEHWESMTKETQQAIWEHIQGLYILGMYSIGRNKELEDMIKLTNFVG